MDYLFAMQEMDLEIASEFLVASTLLHIKSKMLLPSERKNRSRKRTREKTGIEAPGIQEVQGFFKCAQGA